MAKYYQGPYWVRGDDDERWTTATQRIGWTDDDTRNVARAGDHAWYWSEQRGRHVATGDGLTTTDDIAAQLAAGTGGQELAARFWVDAAHLLSDTAWTDLQAVYTKVGIGQRRREDLTPAERAMVEAAENRADAWGEASNRAATVPEFGSEQAGEDADAAQGRDHAEAERIYQVLFDGDYYATIVGDGQAEDSYSDHLWAAAQTHVAMGHTATGLRAQRSADEAAIPAGPPDEHAQPDAEGPTNAAWRTAAAITYREHVLDYGNDGRPEDDRHLSASELAARAMAITTIAAATGVPQGYVSAALRAAADAYGSAPGTDNDPDYLAPPNWDTFTDQYKTGLEPEAQHDAAYHQAGAPAALASDVHDDAELATGDTSARDAPLSADPVLAEQAAELLRHLDATTDTYPGDDSAYWETAPAAVDGAVDAVASTALATHETVPAELTRDGDPVLAADLLDELDQTSARLEAGDVHDEDRPHLAELVEQLRERAAEAIIAEAGPQSEQSRAAELADLAVWRGDDDDCWRTDDGYTPTAQELAERRASSISERENTAIAIGWQHEQLDAERRGWGAATRADTEGSKPAYGDKSIPDELAHHGDPALAAKKADASSGELGELFNTPDEEPPGKSGAARAVASAHEAARANCHRVAQELDDREPAARISEAPELAEADAGTGEDPIERARRAIEHLNAGRAQQAQPRQAQAGHTQQLSAQHADEHTRDQRSSDGFGWGSGW